MLKSVVLPAATLALSLALTGCGSGDPDAEGSPSPSAPTTSAIPSASPSGPVPQPQGAHGVTYQIQNWAAHSEDPAVLAWKRAFEGTAASINRGKVVPGLTAITTGEARRDIVTAVQQAWRNKWQVKETGRARVKSARTKGNKASLVLCLWGPSVGMYQHNGEYFGDPEVFWFRLEVDVRKKAGSWRVAALEYDGKCKGGAPA